MNCEPKYAKLVEYRRNKLVEQVHYGLILYINKSGIIKKIGDDNGYKFFHRSCMKPLQASALIDLNIDKKYKLTQQEIALCCASHTGDKIHQQIVKSILGKLNLTEDFLLCPSHMPLSEIECNYLIINNLKPNKIHNNCSGKHAAMLAVCKEKSFSYTNYTDLSHPLTDFIIDKVCKLCETNKKDIVIAKDGCGLPVIATTLEQLGLAYLNLFTNPKYERITQTFLNNPILIGGKGRLDTEIIQNTNNIIAKVGACGLCVIVNLKEETAIIIKIADSNMEARKLTAFELLKQKKWIDISSPCNNPDITCSFFL